MEINSRFYSRLTPRQRIIATFKALSKDDMKEAKKLGNTCPMKKYYQQKDAAYTDAMERIVDLKLAVECDLLEQALWLVLAQSCNDSERVCIHLQNMNDIEGAWLAFLAEQGLSKDVVLKPLRNPIVAMLLEELQLPKPEDMNKYLVELQQYNRCNSIGAL